MKKLIVTIVALLSMAAFASAANYTVNEEAVDALIENSAAITSVDVCAQAVATSSSTAVAAKSIQPVVALILDFFLGGFGVHRHYMGTSKAMWALYTFTLGGIFGIVPLVDLIMLIIGTVNDDISRYIGNTSFFMWA